MRYRSTRAAPADPGVTFSEAIVQGLAPDGGLYVPVSMPTVSPEAFAQADSMPAVARVLLAPFLAGDPLAEALEAITAEACTVPAPLVPLTDNPDVWVLELYHGPTAAFKDFGARFLAAALPRARALGADRRPLEILVATSGDTGGAVAAAFHRRPGVHVSVLFPRGRVSPTQRHQLTCWGDNVTAYEVDGSFDDCQAMVKAAFADTALTTQFALSSANSINLGRLLPQMVYYAWMALTHWRRDGRAPHVVIPSGNLGNALACVWARAVGLPIATITLAHNANHAVADWVQTGVWRPRPSVATLANAMDVGAPSNMERLLARTPTPDAFHADGLHVHTVSDASIAETIRHAAATQARLWCPHSAVAAATLHAMQVGTIPVPDGWPGEAPVVLVATAHPAKFAEVVEPLVGHPLEMPPALRTLFDRPSHATSLPATATALAAVLRA